MKKILIANRGEIALRIMRSAREMGIKTVAVYSEADRNSPHVRYADEAICLGAAPSSQSYLNHDKVIAACRTTGADAIHPGYGFLSENPKFAARVKQEGLIFIGPSAEAMEIMGNKLAAKAAARKYDIPLVPGTESAIDDVEEAKRISIEVGFPILIKAAAGGGGKGMRIVENEEEFEEQLSLAVSEATSAFGDGSVFIERYVASPRHIEIQLMADNHGNVVYLFERECSIQRRHQKVIEEAPSVAVSPAMRKAMGECAVNVARACNYSGAGTVEFIVEGTSLNPDSNSVGGFYFLEMNTRLQVEHPVSELITGVDLVKEQIRVARNEKLSITQDDLHIIGHAIEVRVYAEDPRNNFLPDIGKLKGYARPGGPGIRLDDGFEEGMDIPIYYDPMISKLITHGKDREEAIARMIRAIDEYRVVGPETTLEFCKFVLQHPKFADGDFDTHFIKNYYNPENLKSELTKDEEMIAAIVAAKVLSESKAKAEIRSESSAQIVSNWKKNRLA